jgi:hypothetical protein
MKSSKLQENQLNLKDHWLPLISQLTVSSCQPSKSDGGSPIKEYIVEKYDKRRLSWSKIGTVDDQTLSFLVPKLIEGTPYQFRVLAVNDEGASEPLITDTEIKPKKAPGNQQLYERRCGLKR